MRWPLFHILALMAVLSLGCASKAVYKGEVFYRCTRVVDGDTLIVKIEGKETRVGLLGADSPDIINGVSYSLHDLSLKRQPDRARTRVVAREALGLTRSLAEGKMVRLEYDMVRYGYGPTGETSTLAYVYLRDGTMLNTGLIRRGLAVARTRDVFRHKMAFDRAEMEAAANQRGLWRPEKKKGEKKSASGAEPQRAATPRQPEG